MSVIPPAEVAFLEREPSSVEMRINNKTFDSTGASNTARKRAFDINISVEPVGLLTWSLMLPSIFKT